MADDIDEIMNMIEDMQTPVLNVPQKKTEQIRKPATVSNLR